MPGVCCMPTVWTIPPGGFACAFSGAETSSNAANAQNEGWRM